MAVLKRWARAMVCVLWLALLTACGDRVAEQIVGAAVPAHAPWAADEVARVHAPSFLPGQQDVYVLEVKPPGHEQPIRWMIDAGHYNAMATTGRAFLNHLGITHLDVLYVTHPHKDHYGGVQALVDNNISIGRLVMNRPDPVSCDAEIPWGCDKQHVEKTIELVVAKGTEHEELRLNDPKSPMVLFANDGIELVLYFAPDNEHAVLGRVDINDMSLLMRLTVHGLSYWFTGDMNRAAGQYVKAVLGEQLRANVLKVPHHGAESTVDNLFFDAVAPQYALVPAPAGLWCSERSERIRHWLSQNRVQTYVMGLHGDVMVRHFANGQVSWQSQLDSSRDCASVLANPKQWQGSIEWLPFEFSVDSLGLVDWAGEKVLRARGWQFPRQANQRALKAGLALVNESDERVNVYELELGQREDVLAAFAHLKLNQQAVGFNQLLRLDGLPAGLFEVVLVRFDNNNLLGTKTGQLLRVHHDGTTTVE